MYISLSQILEPKTKNPGKNHWKTLWIQLRFITYGAPLAVFLTGLLNSYPFGLLVVTAFSASSHRGGATRLRQNSVKDKTWCWLESGSGDAYMKIGLSWVGSAVAKVIGVNRLGLAPILIRQMHQLDLDLILIRQGHQLRCTGAGFFSNGIGMIFGNKLPIFDSYVSVKCFRSMRTYNTYIE